MNRTEKMAHLYIKRHWSLEEIGQLHNISRERVRQILNKVGIDTSKYNTKTQKRALSILARNKNITTEELCEMASLCKTAASRIAKKHNIKLLHSHTKFNPSRRDLVNLYIIQNKSAQTIAAFFDVCIMTVVRKLRNFDIYKIPINDARRHKLNA